MRRANRELLRALADLYGLPVATVADRLLHGDAPGGAGGPALRLEHLKRRLSSLAISTAPTSWSVYAN